MPCKFSVQDLKLQRTLAAWHGDQHRACSNGVQVIDPCTRLRPGGLRLSSLAEVVRMCSQEATQYRTLVSRVSAAACPKVAWSRARGFRIAKA